MLDNIAWNYNANYNIQNSNNGTTIVSKALQSCSKGTGTSCLNSDFKV